MDFVFLKSQQLKLVKIFMIFRFTYCRLWYKLVFQIMLIDLCSEAVLRNFGVFGSLYLESWSVGELVVCSLGFTL